MQNALLTNLSSTATLIRRLVLNTRPHKSGDKIEMLAVLFGQGEVLVIVIITAILVFFLLRRRKK